MSKIYWKAKFGKLEWLFKINFGEDYYDVVYNGKTVTPGHAYCTMI